MMNSSSLRPVGRSGLLLSPIGLGTNNFGTKGSANSDVDSVRRVINAAIDAGVTYIDTAEGYGARPGVSEQLLGEALKGRRDGVQLGTKFGNRVLPPPEDFPGARGSRTYVKRAVESSLRRLQTDWIDLYYLHSPDAVTPIEETLDALGDLVREGKIRYIGNSNFAGWQIAEAALVAEAARTIPFVSAQNHYSLLARGAERELLPAVRRFDLGFIPYFPLAGGLLTGKFRRDRGPEDSRIMRDSRHVWENAPWDGLEALQHFCEERDISMLQAAIGWLLSHPYVSCVITGASSPAQVEQNVATTTGWTPSLDEIAQIEALFPLPADPAATMPI